MYMTGNVINARHAIIPILQVEKLRLKAILCPKLQRWEAAELKCGRWV